MDVPEPIAMHAALHPGRPIPAPDTAQAVLVRGVPTIPPHAIVGMWIVDERGLVTDFAPNLGYRMNVVVAPGA